jgi:hypothetical protein
VLAATNLANSSKSEANCISAPSNEVALFCKARIAASKSVLF